MTADRGRRDPDPKIELGTIVDHVTDATMQVVLRKLKAHGRGRFNDARLMRADIRDAVRNGLRDIRGLGPTSTSDVEIEQEKPSSMPAVMANTTASPYSAAPVVVRPRQACEMLSIGLTRLYELLGEGALESYLHGGTRRITIASIHAYIQRQLAATKTK